MVERRTVNADVAGSTPPPGSKPKRERVRAVRKIMTTAEIEEHNTKVRRAVKLDKRRKAHKKKKDAVPVAQRPKRGRPPGPVPFDRKKNHARYMREVWRPAQKKKEKKDG